MSVRNQFQQQKAPVKDILRRIQIAIGADPPEMADLMRLTTRQFLDLQKSGKEPSLRSTMALCEAINVDFDTLILDKIDYKALVKQYEGLKHYVPEKYVLGASSRRRTVVHFLDFIQKRFSWERRVRLLRSFQLTERMFEDPNSLINLKLSVDIGRWIYSIYRDKNILVEMGRHGASISRATQMGVTLRQARNIRELFELMFGGVLQRFVEQNFIWNIENLDGASCLVRGFPNYDLCGAIGENYLKSHTGCLLRVGFASSIPCYLDYPPVDVSKLACISQGDDFCLFQINFERFTGLVR